MGMVYMQLGRKDEALNHFITTHRLKAASLAEEGHFDKAAALTRDALGMAASASRPDLVRNLERRLRAYERRHVFTEEAEEDPPTDKSYLPTPARHAGAGGAALSAALAVQAHHRPYQLVGRPGVHKLLDTLIRLSPPRKAV
jgi:hypothetical protein